MARVDLPAFVASSLLSLFKGMKVDSRNRDAACVSVYTLRTLESRNQSMNLFGTWFVYNGAWVHLSSELHKPSHQSLCLYMYPSIVARRQLPR
jgi:hypothetical protein